MNMVGTNHDPGRDRPTAIAPNVSAGASAVIAESFAGEPSPLGLSTALELRGGSGRDRERLTFDLGFGWQEELRVTTSTPTMRDHVWDRRRIPLAADPAADPYETNIQVVELNALNAALAVIRWKRLYGFYMDTEAEHFSTYAIDGNHIVNDDRH